MELGPHTYEVYLYVGDDAGARTYAVEHRFHERPDVETVRLLFEEAREHFEVVYGPAVEAEDFAVRVLCLGRPERC